MLARASISPSADPSERLAAGLAALGMEPRPADLERLNTYLDLLIRWRRAYGLTARASRDELVTRHVLDSAAVLPFLPPGPALDAGSGAGLPGLVLAILRPEMEWVLLDSAARKVAFLRHACAELDLSGVRVVRGRLEQHEPDEPPAAIIARALAPLPRLVELTAHLLRRGSSLIAMLGRRPPDQQLHALPGVRCQSLEPVQVPGLEAKRHIAVFRYGQDGGEGRMPSFPGEAAC